jgi:hypothetical protein
MHYLMHCLLMCPTDVFENNELIMLQRKVLALSCDNSLTPFVSAKLYVLLLRHF